MVRQSQDQERNGREDGRQQFPFEGLHVYQRAQEAWSACLAAADQDPLGAEIEREVRRATIGIARATAHSRANGTRHDDGFSSSLEDARASLHAAAALIEQRTRQGEAEDPELRGLLIDGSRMLGALIRTVSQRGEAVETEAVV
jgi:hypothetical protein